MISNKKIELFLFVLSLIEYIQARSYSVSHIGDIRIEKSEDKWICDQIECPLDADRCYVSKSNLQKPTEIVRSNICYSKDDKVLKEKVTKTKNDPKYFVNVHVVCHANGQMSSYNLGGRADFDEEKFHKELEADLRQREADIQSEMADFHENLEREMKELHSNLQKMHEDIRKDQQTRMHDFQKNLRYHDDEDYDY